MVKEQRTLGAEQIQDFTSYLLHQERENATVEKYCHDIREFITWSGDTSVTKEMVLAWREHLLSMGRCPTTVNAKLSALNSLFHFLDWTDCRVKLLKIQRRVFRDQSREMDRDEYDKLVKTAYALKWEWLALIMETICSTGIRVSEVKFITVEAVAAGKAKVFLKGKIREIILPNKLRRKLLKYAKKQKIASGEIFRTETGHSISRNMIWRSMKALCKKAGVEETKVFPHNLRHLFATLFYRAYKDIVKLADVLGHSSINTTRIYLLTTGTEHTRQLDRMGLVC